MPKKQNPRSIWTDSDEESLIHAAIDFKSTHGIIPTYATMADFTPSLNTSRTFSPIQINNKIQSLKRLHVASPSAMPLLGDLFGEKSSQDLARMGESQEAQAKMGKKQKEPKRRSLKKCLTSSSPVLDADKDKEVAVGTGKSSQAHGKKRKVDKEVAKVVVKVFAPEDTKSSNWSNKDEATLLKDAISFRAVSGYLPEESTMGEFFSHVKGTLRSSFTEAEISEKLAGLKEQYFNSDDDTQILNIFNLSSEVWGKKANATASENLVAVKKWSDEDEVALLESAISFRGVSGYLPEESTMSRFLSLVSGTPVSNFTEAEVSDKLAGLKEQYLSSDAGCFGEDTQKQVIYDLSDKLWGTREEGVAAAVCGALTERAEDPLDAQIVNGDDTNGEISDAFPFLKEASDEYCKANGLSQVYLKNALKKLSHDKLKEMEEKWRKHNDEVRKCELSKLDLNRELLLCVVDTQGDSVL